MEMRGRMGGRKGEEGLPPASKPRSVSAVASDSAFNVDTQRLINVGIFIIIIIMCYLR